MFQAFKNTIRRYDIWMLLFAAAATAIGIFFIYSSTKTLDNNLKYIVVQVAAICIGLVLMYVLTVISYEDLAECWKFSAGISVFLLVLVLIIGIGGESTGTKGWIRVGGVGLQPAELVKIFFIFTLAKHLDYIDGDVNYIKNVFLLLLHLAVPVGLILLQPDVGSALVFCFIFIVMLFVAGIDWRYILSAAGGFAVLAVVAWNFFLTDIQKQRFYAFLDPESASSTYGYHVIQSEMAIGSGQLTGKGPFRGIQTQLGFLPEKHTDFIFSVIGEEAGFIMCVIVVLLLFALIWRCIHIARTSKDRLGSFLCMGVAAMWLFHTFENIGMTIGLVPVTGIPLPFISYGGSSALTNYLALGGVLNVAMRRKTLQF